jgi:predicted methyltransferase
MKPLIQTLFGAAITFCTLCALGQVQPDISALLASPVRLPADLGADASRKPVEFLNFTQIKPGMKALDIAAGGGYTSQLLALAVGSQGQVWAQNTKPSLNLKARLDAHPQTNLAEIVSSYENPCGPQLPPLDLITIVLSYHDIAFTSTNRGTMNSQLYQALKPGGHLVIVDHSAKAGTALQDIKTLHRIDEIAVIQEMLAAGFKLEAQTGDWKNPRDTKEEHSTKMTTPSDRFALRFVKP